MHILMALQQQLPLNTSFFYVSYILNVFQNSAKQARDRLCFAFCILFTFDGTYFIRNYSKLVAGHKIHFRFSYFDQKGYKSR